MRSELIGLKGGNKQKYLREHHVEVKQHYFEHGAEATRKEFNLKPDTLERVLKLDGYYMRLNKWSQSDKEVYRTVMEIRRDDTRRITRLEEKVTEFEPVIEFGRGIIRTLGQLQSQGQKIKSLEDPLSLANFGEKLIK